MRVWLSEGRGLLVTCPMTCPLNDEATTTVPGDAPGGGVGESVRKRGWMCASWSAGLAAREVGRETVKLRREWTEKDVDGRSSLDEAERAVCGRSGKGPSRARAGLTGRLPGIVSSVVPLLGMADGDGAISVSLIWVSAIEISHESK
jgi:hypothetical protein